MIEFQARLPRRLILCTQAPLRKRLTCTESKFSDKPKKRRFYGACVEPKHSAVKVNGFIVVFGLGM